MIRDIAPMRNTEVAITVSLKDHKLSVWMRYSIWIAILVTVSLSTVSCIQVREHLVIADDGSGRLIIEVQSTNVIDRLMPYMDTGGGNTLSYPPFNEKALEVLFPGDGFSIEQKGLTEKRLPKGFLAEVMFEDINHLLGSPYGKAKSLELILKDNQLHFRAKTGLERIAFAATLKNTDDFGLPIPIDTEKKQDLSFQFRVTLPGKGLSGNGTVSGKSISWTVNYSEFQNDEMFRKSAGAIMSAASTIERISFSPRKPARLNLDNFSDLKEQRIPLAGKVPDTGRIKGNVMFYPCKIVVKRNVFFSKEAYPRTPSAAMITGLIAIPSDLAPYSWGKVTVLEAMDENGSSLKVERISESQRYGLENQSDQYLTQNLSQGEFLYHPVSFQLKVPAWSSKRISRISSEIEMRYSTDMMLIKVPDVVDNVQAEGNEHYSSKSANKLKHPVLLDVGLDLSRESVQSEYNTMVIGINVKGDSALLHETQIYDSAGRPCVTLLSEGYEYDDTTYNRIVIPGAAEPPLSMAFLVVQGGDSIKVPIEITDVSLGSDKME